MSPTLLLVTSTSRFRPDLAAQVLAEAAALSPEVPAAVSVLYIIEMGTLAGVRRKIGRDGFLGHSTRRDVIDALTESQNQVAELRLERLRAALEAAGHAVTVTATEGVFADVVLAHVAEHDSDLVLLTRADRPSLSRLLFGSEADRVALLLEEDDLGPVIIADDG